MHILSNNRKNLTKYIHIIFFVLCLLYISNQNFMLFHNIIEMITIILGITLMVVSLSTVKTCENNFFHFISIILGFVSIINLCYLLIYQGNSILFNNYNKGVEICIFSEYYQCIMLNLSIRYINKKFSYYETFLKNTLYTVIIILSIIVFKGIPIYYANGKGLTSFHKVSELLFSICFLFILIMVIRSKSDILRDNKSRIIAAIVFKILSCVSFMLYYNTYGNTHGILNLIGYLFKFLAYYYIFKLIFNEILINPYTSLLKKLNNKVDQLDNINKKLDKANYKVQNIEKLNEKFINLIPDGILIVRDKKIESANNRFLNMFEIEDKKELENIYFTEIIDSSYHEIFKSRINNMDRNVLEMPQQYEFVWGNKKKWVETTSLIENDDSGEYIISAIRNIEDRKKAEEVEQLLKLKSQEEKMKNDFIANISHELRTPINVIYSALQVEENYLKKDNTNEHVIKYNKIIKQNCLRLMRLINNIIDIRRIETSFFKPNYRVENIVSVVEDISMSIVEYVKSKEINLIFDTEIEEAYVRCDLDLIERIMLNLLSNSVKYGREGGNIEVDIYKASENSISISVKDDGIGIPDDMKQKIFDRFLKVDNSLSRKAEGSGIGLSLVKQLVEIHKGTITCDSKLNVGTEFKITFPIVENCMEYSTDIDNNINYSQNVIKSTEIEFSDIYD